MPRFSSYTALLTLVAMLGVCSTGQGQDPKPPEPTPEQLREAIAAFEKIGWRYDKWQEEWARQGLHRFTLPIKKTNIDAKLKEVPNLPFAFGLNIEFSPVTGVGLEELKRLHNLTTLYLGPEGTTEDALARLREVRNLSTLIIDTPDRKLSDASFKELRNLKKLTMLEFDFTEFTPQRVNELKECSSLQALIIKYTAVPIDVLKAIKELGQLTELYLCSSKGFTDDSLKVIGEMKNLTKLSLDGLLGISRGVTDTGLKEIKELNKLRYLNLRDTNVTDTGLKELKELKSLAELDLSFTNVHDAGLDELHGMKDLKDLWLYDTKVTNAGIDRLKKKLPNCKVHGPKDD